MIALLSFLKLAGGWIAGIARALPIWAWIAFAAFVAAFVYGEVRDNGGHARGLREGLEKAAKIQKAWDEAVERGQREIAELDRQNAAREAQAKAEGIAIGESRVRDLQDQIAAQSRLVADLRSGAIRLRQHWQGCLSQAQAGDAAALPGGPVPAEQLRAESAARIVQYAADADSKVKRLQEFVQVQQKLCAPNP